MALGAAADNAKATLDELMTPAKKTDLQNILKYHVTLSTYQVSWLKDGMTLGMAVTWNVVIAAEMIAGDNGLGRMTWEGYVSHTSTVVIIGMVSIGLAGYVSALVIAWIERRLAPWKRQD